MKTLRRLLLAILMLRAAALADVIVLKNGLVYYGRMEGSNATTVDFRRSGFLIPYQQEAIRDLYIESDSQPTFGPVLEKQQGRVRELPDWGSVITGLAKQSWATDIRQIPATVIDKGAFRNVPYTSFRCGYGMYELNVYGDPQRPAAFEIGACKSYAGKDFAQSNCLAFASALLADEALRTALHSLNGREGKADTNGVTIEITPPTAEDAYGGWWVSIYIEPMLDSARASDTELNLVSLPTANIPFTAAVASNPDVSWSQQDLKYARPSSAPTDATGIPGGRVYVRSYSRKDGTYVGGHYRSRPRR